MARLVFRALGSHRTLVDINAEVRGRVPREPFSAAALEPALQVHARFSQIATGLPRLALVHVHARQLGVFSVAVGAGARERSNGVRAFRVASTRI